MIYYEIPEDIRGDEFTYILKAGIYSIQIDEQFKVRDDIEEITSRIWLEDMDGVQYIKHPEGTSVEVDLAEFSFIKLKAYQV